MVKYLFTFFILFFFYEAKSADKDKIISNLQKINNLSFTFEQNTNSKKEQGKCIINYPKKIFCKYNYDQDY